MLRFARNDGDGVAPHHAVIPAHAGIQYAAASQFNHQVSGILDHPHARVMTAEYVFAISRRIAPELCQKFLALENEGAGKTGCALHPRSRVRLAQEMLHT
ncbi:hypothetical protein, partial [Bradyrhizobium sp. AUGA SZCCT0160]|uniref:hypothetical protein n=1 Tax=Bradyrhizobium sp. AUGA SZCCT0160 TaxID=2807662 RepID=UPI001BA908CE